MTGFSEVCAQLGLDAPRLAHEVGLPVAALSNPDLKIPSLSVARLLEAAARRSGNQEIGLRMAEIRRLSNMGAVGLIAREQPSLRKALEVMVQYQWMQNDSVVAHIEEESEIAIVRLSFVGEVRKLSRQAVELCIGVLVRNVRSLLGERWRPQAVCFAHPKPSTFDRYRRVLGVAPLFGQEFNGIVFERRDLETKITSADPDMARQIERYVAQMRPDRSIVAETEELIALLLPTGRCTADAVAKRMNVDRRTLHRKLSLERTSFREVLGRQRMALAKSLMADPKRTLVSVADQIGLSGASAFSHWFRRHQGHPPRRSSTRTPAGRAARKARPS
ncbi:MAG: AraC family transcriptional regulator [Alphaproteobacteria bacterium]|nr:AraC family transcriptional regulator [Alphaproteobacteria bacterium]MBL6939476.1 AraC family transcriptional regulator [Alphaproteobacteria bacterium]MBL7097043.1 AraC family transcriptional regulator [Alphaproteobacteria bacterium]